MEIQKPRLKKYESYYQLVFNFLFNKFEIKTDALIDKMIEIRKIFLTQNNDSLFIFFNPSRFLYRY